MQSKAKSVDAYLAELPADRREALEAVRKVILKNIDKKYQEGMQYGMIGYYIPHSVYPDGYHCDPSQPLPFAGMASQKNHMSLYMMCIYGGGAYAEWFQTAWAKTGKKLDMGKACIRFKRVDDLALDVIGEAIRRVPVAKWIEIYEAAIDGRKKRPASKQPAAQASSTKKAAKKPAAKRKAAPRKATKKR